MGLRYSKFDRKGTTCLIDSRCIGGTTKNSADPASWGQARAPILRGREHEDVDRLWGREHLQVTVAMFDG